MLKQLTQDFFYRLRRKLPTRISLLRLFYYRGSIYYTPTVGKTAANNHVLELA
jgi:hypothetical protein